MKASASDGPVLARNWPGSWLWGMGAHCRSVARARSDGRGWRASELGLCRRRAYERRQVVAGPALAVVANVPGFDEMPPVEFDPFPGLARHGVDDRGVVGRDHAPASKRTWQVGQRHSRFSTMSGPLSSDSPQRLPRGGTAGERHDFGQRKGHARYWRVDCFRRRSLGGLSLPARWSRWFWASFASAGPCS